MTAGDPLTLVQVTNTADDSETEPESESDHENTPAAPLVDQKAHDELTSTGVHWQAANNKADDSVTESETEAESEPEHESNHAHHTPVCSSYIFCDMIPLSLIIGCTYSAVS